MQSTSGPQLQLIVLLVGGPYDGQDIAVSEEEWAQGSLIRNRHRYASDTLAACVSPGSSGMRIFTWVDSARWRSEGLQNPLYFVAEGKNRRNGFH